MLLLYDIRFKKSIDNYIKVFYNILSKDTRVVSHFAEKRGDNMKEYLKLLITILILIIIIKILK